MNARERERKREGERAGQPRMVRVNGKSRAPRWSSLGPAARGSVFFFLLIL